MKSRSRDLFKISASIICGKPLDLISDLRLLKKAGVEYLHFDVMDRHFVPRLGLYPEVLKEIKKVCQIPVLVHLMVSEPVEVIEDFVQAGADVISVHAESNRFEEAIEILKKSKVRVGIALKPKTSLKVIRGLINRIDLVLIMAIEPGILGQKMVPGTIKKIKRTKLLIEDRDVLIEVDGGVNFKTSPLMVRAGANVLVCGTSTIYQQKLALDKQVLKYRKVIKKKLDN